MPAESESPEKKGTVNKMSNASKNIVKLLHVSDIHLDSPYLDLPPEKSEERRRELRAAFIRMMQYVRDRGVNIVLICGDLFDIDYATNNTAEIIIREIKNSPDTKFVIAPGSSDRYTDNPIYTSGRMPSNVYIFSDDSLGRFDFDEYNVTVYGWAFLGKTHGGHVLGSRRADDNTRVNIVAGYCDLDGAEDSGRCPISPAEIQNFGADYYAFGSRHSASEFVRVGDSIYSYCGALESCSFSDPGMGGANLVAVEYADEELSVDVKRLSFGHLKHVTEVIDITGVSAVNEVVSRISRMISEKGYGIDTALRVDVVGNIIPSFILPKTFDCESFGLYHFELRDKTLPLYGTDSLKKDMTVKGELYRHLLPAILGKDEETRLIAAKALRIGLAALENREINI